MAIWGCGLLEAVVADAENRALSAPVLAPPGASSPRPNASLDRNEARSSEEVLQPPQRLKFDEGDAGRASSTWAGAQEADCRADAQGAPDEANAGCR
ncbi:unnamed protein product, partial [Prorocentrum cordatum]